MQHASKDLQKQNIELQLRPTTTTTTQAETLQSLSPPAEFGSLANNSKVAKCVCTKASPKKARQASMYEFGCEKRKTSLMVDDNIKLVASFLGQLPLIYGFKRLQNHNVFKSPSMKRKLETHRGQTLQMFLKRCTQCHPSWGTFSSSVWQYGIAFWHLACQSFSSLKWWKYQEWCTNLVILVETNRTLIFASEFQLSNWHSCWDHKKKSPTDSATSLPWFSCLSQLHMN